jgi:hypothetical protein
MNRNLIGDIFQNLKHVGAIVIWHIRQGCAIRGHHEKFPDAIAVREKQNLFTIRRLNINTVSPKYNYPFQNCVMRAWVALSSCLRVQLA